MIRRRRHSDLYVSKTGHERWLVSYADFVTLLFAFFVVMYSVSQVSETKYKVLSESLASVFNAKVAVDAQIKESIDRYPLSDRGEISGLSPLVNFADTKVLASKIQDALMNMVDPSDVNIVATEDWVEVEINSNLLFPSASAEPSLDARSIFSHIATVIAPYENEVEVSGYTDNIPINTPAFRSNWELSSARASSIVRVLESKGVLPGRLSAVGYGEHRPVADNLSREGQGKNRRVVLMVARQKVDRPVKAMDELLVEFPLLPLSSKAQTLRDKDPSPILTTTPELSAPAVEPVRLKNGGLLFSNNPELPRPQ